MNTDERRFRMKNRHTRYGASKPRILCFIHAILICVDRRSSAADLQGLPIADHAHRYPLDGERVPFQVDYDWLELGILGQEMDQAALAPVALDRHLVVDPRYHDLSGTGLAH